MKKITFFVLFIIGLMTVKSQNADFAGGTGTSVNPYKITTAQQLDNLRKYRGDMGKNVYFKLERDIDLSAFISARYPSTGWWPIGMKEDREDTTSVHFLGNLDGNNHTISGLWIDMPNEMGMGLFHVLGDWSDPNTYNYVKNLTIQVHPRGINASSVSGALAGWFYKVQVINCHSNGGPLSGVTHIGGLLGKGYNSIVEGNYTWEDAASRQPCLIEFCSSTNNINGAMETGGLIGAMVGYTVIKNSFSTGNITANYYPYSVGGFIGNINNYGYNNTYIESCYSTGNIDLIDSIAIIGNFIPVGGFIGYCGSNISNCYSTGNINYSKGAGFAGWFTKGTISKCYSTGACHSFIYQADYVNTMSFANECYFDINSSGTSNTGFPNKDFGRSQNLMMQQSTFAGWDFNTTWKIHEGCSYPLFQWQADDENCQSCFAGGTGTEESPYLISNPEQLDCFIDHAQLEENQGMHYRITADIDVYQYSIEQYPQTGWRGNELHEFNGYLHGGGHIISGIWSYRTDSETVGGLFASVGIDGVVDSLGVVIDNRGIIAFDEVGGFVGRNEGEIFSCFVIGGNVQSLNSGLGTGGFVGTNERGYVTDCYSTTIVIAGGYNTDGYTGGLVGINNRGRVEGCYTSGSIVAAFNTVGVLVGYNYNNTNNNVSYNYFDAERSMRSNAIGTDNRTNNRNYGLTTAQMKNRDELVEFDFVDIWKILPGCYPILQWQNGTIVPRSISIENLQLINNENSVITIYPNPTTSMVTIETPEENPTIQVFNASGTMIINTISKTVDLSSYPTGTYIFNINGEIKKVFKK